MRTRRVSSPTDNRPFRPLPPPEFPEPVGRPAGFADAIRTGNGEALFDALDQTTRWDLMTIEKVHREAYDIVRSNYPEGPEREREKRRYEPEATAPSAREIFTKETAPHMVPMMKVLVAGQIKIERGATDDQADAVLENGGRLPFARGQDGGKGYAGLAKQTADDKNRAAEPLAGHSQRGL